MACGADDPTIGVTEDRVVPATASGVYRGDMNFDGVVDDADVDGFVLALSNRGLYEQTYDAPVTFKGDTDDDGNFDFDDIDPFVRLLNPSAPDGRRNVFTDPTARFFGADEIALSTDGRYVIFQPQPDEATGPWVVHDTFTDTRFSVVAPVSLGFDGAYHGQMALSANGRYLVAEASFGGPGHPCPYRTFRYDLHTGEAILTDAGMPSPFSAFPSVSGDGERVVFRGFDATTGDQSVWLADFATNTTTKLVDLHPDTQGFHFVRPQISNDGRIVLIPYYEPSPGVSLLDTMLALYDTDDGSITVIPGTSWLPVAHLSGDGRYVVFADRLSGDTNVYDRLTATTTFVGRPEFAPKNTAVSEDGRFAIYGNWITDLETGETVGLDEDSPPLEDGSISGDGSYVAFRYIDQDAGAFRGWHAPNPLHPSRRPALTGDYNGDGFVNAADYTVWRDQYGSSGGDFSADGDGDGDVDGSDYMVWARNYGSIRMPLGPRPELIQYQGYDEVFDSRRRRVVAFAGLPRSGGPAPTRTYEWDGQAWTERLPANAPPARALFSLGYHPLARQVVLVGGARSGFLEDTWIYDGTNWTAYTGPVPPGRIDANLAYDAKLRKLVLSGGTCAGGPCTDTWTWDGQSWSSAPLP